MLVHTTPYTVNFLAKTAEKSMDMGQPTPSQQAKYADLFERTLDAVLILDFQDLSLIDVNSSGERLLGKTRDELIGMPIASWIKPEEQEELDKALRIARRRYYPYKAQMHWKTPDSSGSYLLMEMVLGTLELAEGQKAVQIIARDVTAQREAEERAATLLKELQEANRKLEALSTTDEMTGLSNFRQFKNVLHAEHLRAERYEHPYAIVFCDVDNFKNYNDRNGHPAGDVLLKELAAIIRCSCRNTDTAARYGGEEFAILCTATDEPGAMVVAKRLRQAVEKHPFAHAANQPLGKVSLSIGVAVFPQDGLTPEAVLEAADKAVYHSKHQGRNRVTRSSEIQAPITRAFKKPPRKAS